MHGVVSTACKDRIESMLTNQSPPERADSLRRVFDPPQPPATAGPCFITDLPKQIRAQLGLDSQPPIISGFRSDPRSDSPGELIVERYRCACLAAWGQPLRLLCIPIY